MENLLATVVFCVTLSVVCGQAANAGEYESLTNSDVELVLVQVG
jgi:hypothetical protein